MRLSSRYYDYIICIYAAGSATGIRSFPMWICGTRAIFSMLSVFGWYTVPCMMSTQFASYNFERGCFETISKICNILKTDEYNVTNYFKSVYTYMVIRIKNRGV